MYSIVLLCQHGASTGIVGEKVAEAAKEKGIDVVVNAYSLADVKEVINDADVILLGPQVRFQLKSLVEEYGDRGVPIITIEPADYGRMNGENILNTAINAIEKK